MTNIEFKAHLRNPTALSQVLAKHSQAPAAILIQTDTYFQVENGRLKLREIEGETAQLIFYQRPDRADVKRSDYCIAPVASPAALREVLAAACGIRVVVKKRRELYLLPRKISAPPDATPNHTIRLHLDNVEGLGQFIEIEVIVEDGDPPQAAQAEARALANELCVEAEDFISGSYADLLESSWAVKKA
jgi:predicted adenylyl cyclase CyaB